MKRASLIAIVPVVVLFALWAIPGLAQETTPKDNADAPAKAADAPEKAADAPAKGADALPKTDTPAQSPEITEALNLFRQRDAEGALKQLKKAVAQDPELPPASVILAQFFAAANMATGMRNALEQAVKDNPDDPQAYMVFADIAMRDRRLTEAQLLYEKANSLMPKFNVAKRKKVLEPQVLAGLAMTSEARDDWAAARHYVEKWLTIDPKNTMAMRELAQCMLRQKHVTEALEELVAACKIDKTLLSPEATLAQFYRATGEQKETRKWMVQALKNKPSDVRTRLLASQWALETGKLSEAETQADAALKLLADADKTDAKHTPEMDQQQLEALVLRGVVAIFQKNYKAAEQYSQQAYLLKPNNFSASNNLALALAEQGSQDKKERALAYAEANAQTYGKTNQAGEAYSTYGWVLYRLGRFDEAEKYLRGVIQGGTYSPDTAYYYARLLAKRDHVKDAVQLLDNAL
jgi:tetratricopeptide (TPR) repeat protein